jgi:hypothetical protein
VLQYTHPSTSLDAEAGYIEKQEVIAQFKQAGLEPFKPLRKSNRITLHLF